MESTEILPSDDLRSDEEIVAAVVEGEVDSFEELILRYQPRIF